MQVMLHSCFLDAKIACVLVEDAGSDLNHHRDHRWQCRNRLRQGR